jgi:hypothetical protein
MRSQESVSKFRTLFSWLCHTVVGVGAASALEARATAIRAEGNMAGRDNTFETKGRGSEGVRCDV